jgi:hypothetical protein
MNAAAAAENTEYDSTDLMPVERIIANAKTNNRTPLAKAEAGIQTPNSSAIPKTVSATVAATAA